MSVFFSTDQVLIFLAKQFARLSQKGHYLSVYLCYCAYMKTISLSEDAYRRLLAYKGDDKDSFTKVILRVLPEKGSAAEIGESIADISPLTEQEAGVIEKVIAEGNQWQENAWK